ncbi:MAG: hypothetical protein WCW13_06900 [archaeon]|jgi:hypothetical protein
MQMEERIIEYEDFSQVQQIVLELALEEFELVEHKSRTKQLFFKKLSNVPETLIVGED